MTYREETTHRKEAWAIDPVADRAETADGLLWVDVRQQALAWSNDCGSAQVLQLICGDGRPHCREVYARRNELVARYDDVPVSQSSAELRWRYDADCEGAHWQLDWLLSLQTERLELDVNCTCRSQWGRKRLFVRTSDRGWFEWDGSVFAAGTNIETQAIAVELADDRCYFEAIWPADYGGIYLGRMMEYTVAAWRFAEAHLEKGVIRRVRMRACCLASRFDSTLADRVYDSFVQSPVPLTA